MSTPVSHKCYSEPITGLEKNEKKNINTEETHSYSNPFNEIINKEKLIKGQKKLGNHFLNFFKNRKFLM